MYILGIETSCDETAAAVVTKTNDTLKVLSNIILSQIKTHQKFGGVVPEVAARLHSKNILYVIDKALKEAKITASQLTAIAVTSGPGLVTSLIVGLQTAKTLSYLWQKPLISVNHMQGHMMANVLNVSLKKFKFPALCLIVSGGHTELVLLQNFYKFKIIGQTRDDAVGEAYDKVSKILGLGYPGGPIVAQKAAKAKNPFVFPKPMLNSTDLNFSFSGLKTAVLYKFWELQKLNKLTKAIINNLAAGFQQAALEVLIHKTIKAAVKHKVKTVMLGGGVSANQELRHQLKNALVKQNKKLIYLVPDLNFCTDNAAMIAAAGTFACSKKKFNQLNKIKVNPVWSTDHRP